jgi:hypothetical protein
MNEKFSNNLILMNFNGSLTIKRQRINWIESRSYISHKRVSHISRNRLVNLFCFFGPVL